MLSIIKNKFPWWFKILTKLILSRLPISYNFWSKINIFRHGQMDNSDYAFKIFSHHIHQEENKLNGKTILEIGPGDSLSSGIIAYYYGAKSILVNPSKFIFDPLENFNNLKIFLENKGFKVIDTPTNLDELCKKHKISYFVDGLESLKSIESNSVDIIFSNAVLEHIEKKNLKILLKN